MLENYKPRWPFTNPHFNTLFTHLFRKSPTVNYQRERIFNRDNYSLYLDWVKNSNDNLLILTHGLESNSHASYIKSMAHEFIKHNFDILAWNCLGCATDEPAEKNSYYHSGVSHDLNSVVGHIQKFNSYKNIYLVGFSMGGNITLKYLGENASHLSKNITASVAISTPIDLKTSSESLAQKRNHIYTRNFLATLRKKILKDKADLLKLDIDITKVLNVKNLIEFDEYFTAPIHGFSSSSDYYIKASSIDKLKHISVPTLIINALDDPFLGTKCFPTKAEISNNKIETYYPKHGGHVGFYTPGKFKTGWIEQRVLDFFLSKKKAL